MNDLILGLTLEQISALVIFVGGLIAGIKYLKKEIGEALKKILEGQFKEMNDKLDNVQEELNGKLDEMEKSIKKLDIQTSKNFLIRYLADIERGEDIYESEKQRFWDEYKHYKDDLKENAYITEWVDKLKKEGKL